MKKQASSQKNNRSGFWHCYRIPLIICLSLLTVLLLVARKYVELNSRVLTSGITVNVAFQEAAAEELKEHLREQLSSGGKWEKVRLSQVELEDFSEASLTYRDNYYMLASIQSLGESGELDYILADQLALETLIKQQVFCDLNRFFTSQELEALGTRVIYARSSQMDAEESYPVAVDITQLPYIQENAATADKVYFGLTAESSRLEQTRLVWEYLCTESQ